MPYEPESTLLEFIRYNQWATQQLLTVCKGLTDEQLNTPIPGAFGTVRETVRHMLYAEADYVGRITGAPPPPPFQWDEAPSLDQFHAFAEQVAQVYLDVIARVPPTTNVHEEDGGFTMDYQARQLYMQVINHGIEHRVNITTYLNTLGIALPELDHWGYMFAHPDRFGLREGKSGETP